MSTPIQGRLSEKEAVAIVQMIPAEQLDKSLPKFPFGSWFNTTVGNEAGIVWQMTECGESAQTTDGQSQDLKVCTEANAVLPDGRKIVIMVNVGTFRKGFVGTPTIFMAAVEQNDQLYKLKKISELPKILMNPKLMPTEVTDSAELLPRVDENVSAQTFIDPAPVSVTLPSQQKASLEDPGIPPPPKPEANTPNVSSATTVVAAQATQRFSPLYTQQMRLMNARGSVKVAVTIDDSGKVIKAQAITGHPILRNPATEAARKWTFKPATHNGKPVQSDITLNFEFTR